MVGGFIYPFSDVASSKEEMMKRAGYLADNSPSIKEAKELMAAAGHPNGIEGLDFLVREVASFKLWSQAIQAMLQQALNVKCNLRTVVESVWFDDVNSGNYDMAIGAIVSTLIDPSDYFNAWYATGGPQNYSNWSVPEFDALVEKIDNEVNPTTRQGLIKQAEMIMEENPPLLPIAWEKINDGWYNYVKGHVPDNYFGIYDVVRLDTFWLDK
jgi:ABC-type transport system substrate-binding protein